MQTIPQIADRLVEVATLHGYTVDRRHSASGTCYAQFSLPCGRYVLVRIGDHKPRKTHLERHHISIHPGSLWTPDLVAQYLTEVADGTATKPCLSARDGELNKRPQDRWVLREKTAGFQKAQRFALRAWLTWNENVQALRRAARETRTRRDAITAAGGPDVLHIASPELDAVLLRHFLSLPEDQP